MATGEDDKVKPRASHLARMTIGCLALAVFAWPATALAFAPSAPLYPDPWVSGVGAVSMTWTASIDPEGDPVTYDVYRYRSPITAANLASATRVAQGLTGTSVTDLPCDPAEIAQSYVWYYAVVARAGADSVLSKTAAPNLHSNRSSSSVYGCNRCHDPHTPVSYDVTRIELCYSCHGSSQTTNPESALGDRSTLNIKSDFYDYDSQSAARASGSQHRSARMTAAATECDVCHTAHRSPYFWPNGTPAAYDPVQSFRKLLRAQTGVDGTGKATFVNGYYSRNDNTAEGGAFCFSCHGSTTASPADGSAADNMAFASAGGYAATAGDHNEAGYGSAAHGPAIVRSNDYGRVNEAEYPQIQCLACHENHASAADKLIAYRGADTAGTPSGTYAQAELCFACHSGGSAETKVTGSTKPYAWNARDVKVQFAKNTPTGGSSHPTVASDAAPVPQPGSVTHTTAADFDRYALADAVADATIGDGAIRLAANTPRFYTGWEDQSFAGWTPSSATRITATAAGGPYAGAYHAEMAGDATTRTELLTRSTAISTTGLTSPTLTFWWYTTALSSNADWFEVQVATNNTFTTNLTTTRLVTGPSAARSYARATVGLPVSGTVYVRFRFTRNSAVEDAYIDEITVPVTGYMTSGNAISGAVAPTGLSSWTRVSGAQTAPAGTTLTYDVLDGATNAAVSGYTGRSLPIDISGVSATTHPSLKVRANLTGGTNTPAVESITFEYMALPGATGSLTCASCHNVHSVGKGGTEVWDMARASDPANTKLAAPADATTFCLRCHKATDAEGRALVAAATATSLVPYTVKFTSPAAPFFPGWDKTLTNANWSASAHENPLVRNMNPGCDTCHDPHASDNPRLTALTAYRASGGAHINERRNNSATYAEEDLCYACHTVGTSCAGSGSGCHSTSTTYTRSVTAIDVQTPLGQTYKHPVTLDGRHSDTETATDLGDGNRHAECADCHDPHAARSGLHTSNLAVASNTSLAGPALRGATGVKPTTWPQETANPFQSAWNAWSLGTAGYTVVRMDGESTDYEAYVCFKCHSSYTTLPATVTRNAQTYTPTDVAREFNPNNQSEHNVLGQTSAMRTAFTIGTQPVTMTKPTDGAFLITANGWTSNSAMTCTDCHSNTTAGAKGPHGASNAYMLVDGRTWSASTTLSNYSTSICGKCHTNLANSNNVHNKHAGRSGDNACQQCHIRIPHGWKRPRLLGYVTDPEPYRTIGQGLEGIVIKSYTQQGWTQNNDCLDAGCYGNEHAATGTIWP